MIKGSILAWRIRGPLTFGFPESAVIRKSGGKEKTRTPIGMDARIERMKAGAGFRRESRISLDSHVATVLLHGRFLKKSMMTCTERGTP